jgi:hypothetical protein
VKKMQHYPRPEEVCTTFPAPSRYSLRKLKEIISKDGLIVPILVNEISAKMGIMHSLVFEAADQHQSDRVTACEELGFETILVETDWTEEDL